MLKTMANKQLKLIDLGIVLATRDIARFVMQTAENQKYEAISFQDAVSCSRSFLDELYVISQKNHIRLVDMPDTILPLLDIIERSHKSQKVFAPRIKVRVSDTTFA
ncbi:hypothetical protein A2215_01365 [Candidatus Berkelbacteria bacterium RIFOXYA2_FULL_43_10]|uniref:Uncharacterized protein n=1 Tax=Candidatus Berkelbacteria bacterium RIFOXYA2_FULL_43_10 TaxID=1797472 RepID=A0A1F5E977_9BACT|nr:MAG: hypothetical protein A2215_01365 [Candidatus Berkelbacteria bacterium RIFOXYA2_FULL_43_10]